LTAFENEKLPTKITEQDPWTGTLNSNLNFLPSEFLDGVILDFEIIVEFIPKTHYP
jgi:hypothetical protein